MQHKYVLHNIAASKVLYDSVLVVAGGWVGGSIQDKDCFKKAKLMMKKNLYPSILGAHIATRFLKP